MFNVCVVLYVCVESLGADYRDILEALKASRVLEVDAVNETVRPRDKPQQWVFPTPAPRWIKLETGPSSGGLQGSGPHLPSHHSFQKRGPRPRRGNDAAAAGKQAAGRGRGSKEE